jgi:hypothetical protein
LDIDDDERSVRRQQLHAKIVPPQDELSNGQLKAARLCCCEVVG